MAVRKGLGRGLDLLIPKDEGMPKKSTEKNKENKEPKENQVLTLSIHDVEPNRNQPRKQFDEDAIELVRQGINPLSFPGLKYAISSEESKMINFDTNPKVIISASESYITAWIPGTSPSRTQLITKSSSVMLASPSS